MHHHDAATAFQMPAVRSSSSAGELHAAESTKKEWTHHEERLYQFQLVDGSAVRAVSLTQLTLYRV
jgi:hypothetical protein